MIIVRVDDYVWQFRPNDYEHTGYFGKNILLLLLSLTKTSLLPFTVKLIGEF